jgi:hypothetical protein
MTGGKVNIHSRDRMRNVQSGAKREARSLGGRLARAGYIARGIIYSILGVLVLQAAIHFGNPNLDKNDVIGQILARPQGQLILAILALALLGYAGWRLAQGILNVEHQKKDKEGIAQRVGYVLSGLSYGLLAISVIQILAGYGQARKNSLQDITAQMLRQPVGRVILGLAGLLVVALGIYMLYRAWKGEIERNFQTGKMDSQTRRWVIRAGRFGYAARAVIYIPIGIFLLEAALQYKPQKAGGFGQALQALDHLPYGPYVVALVALGLVAYGIYSIMLGMYRRIRL